MNHCFSVCSSQPYSHAVGLTKYRSLVMKTQSRRRFFSYQMQNKPLQRNEEIYFLQIEKNKDPTADLMKRLTDKKYAVESGSKSVMLQGIVQDKDSKKIGLLLEIRSRTCASLNQCEVQASIRSRSDNVEGWRYELSKENN